MLLKYITPVLKKLIIMIITNFITFLDSLSVFIHPQRQMVEIGQSVSLSCVVAGGPFTSINWIKDGKFLKEDEGALASSVSILNISEVKMNSEGMYQCFVQNGQDEKQAVGQIILSAIPPSIVKTFNRKQKRPGEGVTLECSATGEPLPQMAWLLRELEIKNSSRTNIEVKEKNGKVTIKLTISFLQTEDGGMYTCMAENKVGKASYTEIMDVYGVPRVWPLVNQTVVDGKPVTINCHVSGYPIKSIYWTKDKNELLEDDSVMILKNGSLWIPSTRANIDNGKYECLAENNNGYSSTGTGYLKILVGPTLDKLTDKTLSIGDRLTLVCTIRSGNPPLDFTWLFNGNTLPYNLGVVISDSSFLSTLSSTNIKREHAGNYTCIANNNAGSTSTFAMVKIQGPPEWARRPTTTEVNINGLVSIPCSGRGFPSTRAIWMKLEDKKYVRLYNTTTKILIFTNGTLTINNIEEKDLSTYQCKISNGFQPSLVAKLQLKLKAQRIDVDIKPNSLESPSSEPIEIKCKAKGNEMLNLRWFYGGLPVESESGKRIKISFNKKLGAIESVLSIKNTIPSDSGLYTCRVSNDKFTNSSAIYVKITGKYNLDFRNKICIKLPEKRNFRSFKIRNKREYVRSLTFKIDFFAKYSRICVTSAIYYMKEDNKNFQTGLPTKESSLNPSDDRNGIKFTLMNISFCKTTSGLLSRDLHSNRLSRGERTCNLHFNGVALLYVIPTSTAAIVLLVILVIVCFLLHNQRQKIKEIINCFLTDSDARNSTLVSKRFDEDKLGDFYKAPSDTNSSNKYYEIRPSGTSQFTNFLLHRYFFKKLITIFSIAGCHFDKSVCVEQLCNWSTSFKPKMSGLQLKLALLVILNNISKVLSFSSPGKGLISINSKWLRNETWVLLTP
ncbi:Down syndrome cell adhesion molecule-like protein Dscam2 [Nymphon striatum]|nr:Down syndrome cell adhesion molecule-like protein Dscam2 [Nymphon striatum]